MGVLSEILGENMLPYIASLTDPRDHHPIMLGLAKGLSVLHSRNILVDNLSLEEIRKKGSQYAICFDIFSEVKHYLRNSSNPNHRFLIKALSQYTSP